MDTTPTPSATAAAEADADADTPTSTDSPTKSDGNMQRSAELQASWRVLRAEMDTILSTPTQSPAQQERKEAIAARMETITEEMTAVLQRAQARLPPADLVAEDLSDAPVLSLHGRHRIERTYDSSDSDGPPSSRMRDTMCTSPRVIVESPAARVKNERTVLTALGTKLRSTLRISDSPRGAAAPVQAAGAARLTADERRALKLEESKLERELRTIQRLSDPGDGATARGAQIASRLKEITDQSLDGGGAGAGAEDAPHVSSTVSFAAKAAKALSPRRWGGGGGASAGGASAGSPGERAAAAPDSRGSSARMSTSAADAPARGERKGGEKKGGGSSGSAMRKGWGSLRSALEKKVLHAAAKARPAPAPAPPPGAAAKDGASTSPASVALGAESSEFAETRNRLAQRGERLGALGADAEAMREGAGDFLAAARALRKKNTKRGIF